MSDDTECQNPSKTDGRGTDDTDEASSDPTTTTRIEFSAYDLRVEAESEEADFHEMAEVLSEEFAKIRRDALMGEMVNIEERGLHWRLLGGEE